MKDCRPVTSMISSRVLSRLASAISRHSRAVASGSRYMRTLARPRATVCSPTSGSTAGSGPSGSWSDRSRFHSCSSSLIAVCPLTCWWRTSGRLLPGLGLGVAEREGHPGQHLQLVRCAAVAGQPGLHVGVEGLPGGQRRVPGEDRVGGARRELAALLGVAGLEDHRAALRAARHAEPAGDVELVAAHGEPARVRLAQEHPGSGSATTASPRQESNSAKAAARNSWARS